MDISFFFKVYNDVHVTKIVWEVFLLWPRFFHLPSEMSQPQEIEMLTGWHMFRSGDLQDQWSVQFQQACSVCMAGKHGVVAWLQALCGGTVWNYTNRGFPTRMVYLYCVSLLYIMLEIHHPGREPSKSAWVYDTLYAYMHIYMYITISLFVNGLFHDEEMCSLVVVAVRVWCCWIATCKTRPWSNRSSSVWICVCIVLSVSFCKFQTVALAF